MNKLLFVLQTTISLEGELKTDENLLHASAFTIICNTCTVFFQEKFGNDANEYLTASFHMYRCLYCFTRASVTVLVIIKLTKFAVWVRFRVVPVN